MNVWPHNTGDRIGVGGGWGKDGGAAGGPRGAQGEERLEAPTGLGRSQKPRGPRRLHASRQRTWTKLLS